MNNTDFLKKHHTPGEGKRYTETSMVKGLAKDSISTGKNTTIPERTSGGPKGPYGAMSTSTSK